MTKITNKDVVRLCDGLQQIESSGAELPIKIIEHNRECYDILEADFDIISQAKDKLLKINVKQDGNGMLLQDATGFVYNSYDAKQSFLSNLGELMSKEKEYDLPKIKRQDLPKTIKSVRNISLWLRFCVEK